MLHSGGRSNGFVPYLIEAVIDVLNQARAMELLAGAGYSGYLSGEWIKWEPAEVHLPREIATMKGYEG